MPDEAGSAIDLIVLSPGTFVFTNPLLRRGGEWFENQGEIPGLLFDAAGGVAVFVFVCPVGVAIARPE